MPSNPVNPFVPDFTLDLPTAWVWLPSAPLVEAKSAEPGRIMSPLSTSLWSPLPLLIPTSQRHAQHMPISCACLFTCLDLSPSHCQVNRARLPRFGLESVLMLSAHFTRFQQFGFLRRHNEQSPCAFTTTCRSQNKQFTNRKIDPARLTRGLSAVLCLKSSVSEASRRPRLLLQSHSSRVEQILWQLGGGGAQERDKESEGERKGLQREGAGAPQLQVTACMPMRRFPCNCNSSSSKRGSLYCCSP